MVSHISISSVLITHRRIGTSTCTTRSVNWPILNGVGQTGHNKNDHDEAPISTVVVSRAKPRSGPNIRHAMYHDKTAKSPIDKHFKLKGCKPPCRNNSSFFYGQIISLLGDAPSYLTIFFFVQKINVSYINIHYLFTAM